jgi:hypothetical protein
MASWDELDVELDAWGQAGLEASFWVRDDDAVAATPALEKFIRACSDVPVALAVIPAGAEQSLADVLTECPHVHVLQHGYAHANHAREGEKKIELADHRGREAVRDELAAGRQRLEALFGAQFLPVIAPPWNRIGPDIAAHLADWGYTGLSIFKPRDETVAAQGLVRVNTHVDIIDWKGTRGFRGEAAVLAQAIGHLSARRTGAVDRDEPTGLITHHLVHDAGCDAFVEAFIARVSGHPAARWPAIDEIF